MSGVNRRCWIAGGVLFLAGVLVAAIPLFYMAGQKRALEDKYQLFRTAACGDIPRLKAVLANGQIPEMLSREDNASELWRQMQENLVAECEK